MTGLRDLTIRQLRALAALSANGSVTAAANALQLTQPAVTLQLRNLQDLAGLPLIQRVSDGMRLTIAGEALVRLYERIDGAIGDCQTSLEMIAGRSGGGVALCGVAAP